ncbi:hypothetical protein [Dactylosporangium sp. NPDC048998]|uniref:hypothetical protein n=1 Tax=Dactylosporangium sp. NPDC048998 TaxID=3363976 RepID=UPI0037233C31
MALVVAAVLVAPAATPPAAAAPAGPVVRGGTATADDLIQLTMSRVFGAAGGGGAAAQRALHSFYRSKNS